LLAAKRRLYERYAAAFADVPGVRLVSEPAGCRSNYWLQTLLLDPAHAAERDEVLAVSNDADLMTRPVWVLNHRLPAFCDCPRMPLPAAESLEQRVINVPSSAQLAMEPSG
jgi:perosamine synthetase